MNVTENPNDGSNNLLPLLQSFCLNSNKITVSKKAVEWSLQTGLGSIVYEYGVFDLHDALLVEKLASHKLNYQFWFQTQLNKTKQIVELLNKVGITPTLLKGMSISSDLYLKAYFRTMRDIDILVDVKEVDTVEKILSSLNFQQQSVYSKEFYESGHHHTMPWQHVKDDIWIEVHTKLFPKSSCCYDSPVFQLDVIQNEKIQGKLYEFDVNRLSYEFQIIYIASHWAEQFKQIGGLFALLDVALIINQHNNLDWEKIISWSNTPYVSNYVYLILQYLNRNGLLNPNINIDTHFNRIQHTLGFISISIMNKMIDDYLLAGKGFGRILTVNNISIIWKDLLEPSSSIEKILLIPVSILFPKGVKNRFSIKFQWSRLKSVINFRKQ